MKVGIIMLTPIWGFCMALADSVPGVSGGTIAFILGFYDKFISSLNGLLFGNKKEKMNSLKFLLKLFIGWFIGMILAVLLLSSLFTNHIYKVSSLFLGFIIFSIPLICKEEKAHLKGQWQNLIYTVLGIAIVVLITYFNPTSSNASFDLMNLHFGSGIYIFLAAMLAISAMVLPGISGSTLLLIFGLYIPIITAVKELLHFNFAYLPAIIIFIGGLIVGIALMIKSIKTALEKKRSIMIYFIIGLMIGSLYAIIMGPTTLEIPASSLSFETFSILWFLIGGLLIYGFDKLKEFKKEE